MIRSGSLGALEVFRISGKTLTELTKTQGESLPYKVHQFAITPKDRGCPTSKDRATFRQNDRSRF